MLHGSNSPALARWAAKKSLFAERSAPSGIGYTNLFGPLAGAKIVPGGPSEEFSGYGEATETILVKLARRLERPYDWPVTVPSERPSNDNPRLPSGYTYLAQFIAHDLTFLSSTLPPLADIVTGQRNLRSIALNLDTLYGGGPLERPSLFCLEPNGGPRVKLRLGLIDNGLGPATTAQARSTLARDLPRAACPMTLDAAEATKHQLTEVLIADPRNDDHLLVAQLTVLFHLLHNEMCDRIASNPAAYSPEHVDADQPTDFTAQERDVFASARRVVGAVYRDIIRFDLLKRLLCDTVHAHYVRGADALLDRQADGAMPVEFSHAAFRIGHAMVRPSYEVRTTASFDLETILLANSETAPGLMPPSRNWIVHWSNFFETAGAPVNLSRRIAPSYTRVLSKSPLISLTDDRDHPDVRTGLPRRDLLRSAATRMRSVESLIRRIRVSAPDLLAGSGLLRDEDPHRRRAAVRAFLDGGDASDDGLTDGDKDAIAADPPLLLFLLLEAALEEGGRSLGVLGSVIVAEVVFGALHRAERSEVGRTPDLKSLMTSAFGYDPDAMARGAFETRTPRSMPELIAFLASLPNLENADPVFA